MVTMTTATSSLDSSTGFRTHSDVHGAGYRSPTLPQWHNHGVATQRQIDSFVDYNGRDNRLSFCGKAVTGPVVGLVLGKGGARYVGQARCDSWDCPRCAAAKAGKAAHRLADATRKALDAGLVPYFTTFTMSHDVHDSLERCVRAGREGWRKVRRVLSSSPYVAGQVAAWEVTLGRKGWHLHCHALLFLRDIEDVTYQVRSDSELRHKKAARMNAALIQKHWVEAGRRLAECTERKVKTNTARMKKTRELAEIGREIWMVEGERYKFGNLHNPLRVLWRAIAGAWCDGVAKTGMHRPDPWRQHLELAKTDEKGGPAGLVNYLVKTAYEICGSAYKQGRRGSWTPRGFLELAAIGNQEGRRAWREYREAMAGVHRVSGIAQLEKVVGKTEPERHRPAIVAAITPENFLLMRNLSLDAPIRRLASAGCPMEGAWTVKDMLGTLDEYETPRSIRGKLRDTYAGGPLMLQALVHDAIDVVGVNEWTLTQFLEPLSPQGLAIRPAG